MDIQEYYQEKADAQLHEWQEWIETYKSDPSISREKNFTNLQQRIAHLDLCQHIAQVRLEELRLSTDAQWELAKQAVERAMIDLKRALDESGAGQAGRCLHVQTSRARAYEPFSKRG